MNFFTWQTLVGYLISLLVGLILKRWPKFMNEFIPIAHIVIGILTQIIAAAMNGTAAPVAVVAPTYMIAGFFDGAFFKILIPALLQAAAAHSTYQTPKSTIKGLMKLDLGD